MTGRVPITIERIIGFLSTFLTGGELSVYSPAFIDTLYL
jgi:hypothetical protein